ncbi:MAG: hypothetical protein AAFR37_22870 [Cyanobacteria bacterium J06628_3]
MDECQKNEKLRYRSWEMFFPRNISRPETTLSISHEVNLTLLIWMLLWYEVVNSSRIVECINVRASTLSDILNQMQNLGF